MKKLLSVFAVLSLIFIIQACKRESAVDYNNRIIEHQQAIVYKIDRLKKAIDNYDILPADEAVKVMNVAYDSALFRIDSGLKYIKKVEDFRGDKSLRDGAENLFNDYKNIIEKDYKQIIELYKIPDEMFTKEDVQTLDSLLETSNAKLEKSFKDFKDIQKEFAKKYDLELE